MERGAARRDEARTDFRAKKGFGATLVDVGLRYFGAMPGVAQPDAALAA
jgi:hypothetical protein